MATKAHSSFLVIKNFILYAIGSLFLRTATASISFLVIKSLTPHEYGLLSLLNTASALLPVFLGFGLRQACSLEYFHHTFENRLKVVNDIVILYLTGALPLCGIFIVSMPIINTYFFAQQATTLALIIVLIIAFNNFFAELLLQILRYQQRALTLLIIQCFACGISMITAYFFIQYLHDGFYGSLCAHLTSSLTLTILSLYWYAKNIFTPSFSRTFNLNTIRNYLTLGLPFIPSMLSTWLLAWSNRWILAHMASIHEVGIYALADSCAQLFTLIILMPLNASYIPSLFEQFAHKSKSINTLDKRNLHCMIIAMIIVASSITALFFATKTLLKSYIPLAYHEAIPCIWIVLLSSVCAMGSVFGSCYLQFYKRTRALVVLTLSTALLNGTLSILFTPTLRMYGCALSLFIAQSYHLIALLIYTYSIKQKIPVLRN